MGDSIRHDLCTLIWFDCKSLIFYHPTAIVVRFQYVEGESKTNPLQDSSARVMEGESVVGKREISNVWLLIWFATERKFKAVLWYVTGRRKYYKSFLVGYTWHQWSKIHCCVSSLIWCRIREVWIQQYYFCKRRDREGLICIQELGCQDNTTTWLSSF